jgi:hypothetical protein
MTFDKNIRPNLLLVSAALFISTLTLARDTSAQSPTTPQSQEQVSVAGHLDLQGMPVKQILLQQRGNKTFLFLRRADKNAFTLVEVTNPANPVLVAQEALREPAGASVDLPSSGSVLAIVFVPDRNSGSTGSAPASVANLPTESIRLIDLSDPKHPKVIRTFNGVTSVASDDGRKLIFLANNEGLWIVSHHRPHPLPMCTSESELESIPHCQ